jgi:hypothetical protein
MALLATQARQVPLLGQEAHQTSHKPRTPANEAQRAALAAGRNKEGRPKLSSEGRLQVQISREKLDELDAWAEAHGLSRSAAVAALVTLGQQLKPVASAD